MSDFVSRDMLPDLWDEILRRHWTFLETEECMQKLEERKKLEGCLKEFLCIVPHDRKFFLPETGHVLRRSIRDLTDFTAHKAIIGFEAVSQYANNLFTKPWRKEFRVLKTYSGFFEHEIKSNLHDADKMFEAMGYRRISDEVFVLDGPICPDQVTNVSRDAMAAYVECQIIKYIYAGLSAIGLSCTWQDIFHYRERHVGGTTQAIKEIAYILQEKRLLRKESLLNTENTYGNIQPQQQQQQQQQLMATSSANQCDNCTSCHQLTKSQYAAATQACAVHNNAANASSNSCALHPNLSQSPNLMYNGNVIHDPNKLIASYPAPGYQQHAFVAPPTHAQQQQAQMTHSRSLEHYNEPNAIGLPHRHSFDHQQQGCTAHHHHHVYEAPYDCLDGVSMGSSVSYAAIANGSNAGGYSNAYAHPYNAPGNRYPLPYNISNQLNTQYSAPNVTCNGIKNIDPYAATVTPNENNAYALISKQQHNCNYHNQQQQHQHLYQQQQQLPVSSAIGPIRQSLANASSASNPTAAAAMQYHRQCSFPPDHLIDFDDRAQLTQNDFHAQMHMAEYDPQRMYDRRRTNMNATYAQPKDHLCAYETVMTPQAQAQAQGQAQPTANDMYVYARPIPKSNRVSRQPSNSGVNNLTDKFVRNMELNQDFVDNNRKKHKELKETQRATSSTGVRRKLSTNAHERDTLSDMTSYESASLDDFVTVGHGGASGQDYLLPSPTLISKNQEGVGSFESWNYVFQNLERSGYSKDLGDREDLFVQSLDLDSLTLANGHGSSNVDKRRSAHIESSKSSNRVNSGGAVATAINDKTRTLEKTPSSFKRDVVKSAAMKPDKQQQTATLKQTTTAGNINVSGSSGRKIKSALKTTNLDSNKCPDGNHALNSRSSNNISTNTNASGTIKINKQPPPVSTQLIVTSPNEWSCRFCTFLNPDTIRVCEMCSRSKDFNLEASSVSHASTCV